MRTCGPLGSGCAAQVLKKRLDASFRRAEILGKLRSGWLSVTPQQSPTRAYSVARRSADQFSTSGNKPMA